MKKLIIFALLAVMVSCKKDEVVLPEVCEMWKFKERRVTNTRTGVIGQWEPDPSPPVRYSSNCWEEGKILPGDTHNPSGQILEYRFVIRRR